MLSSDGRGVVLRARGGTQTFKLSIHMYLRLISDCAHGQRPQFAVAGALDPGSTRYRRSHSLDA
jgi:hypothetical protein